VKHTALQIFSLQSKSYPTEVVEIESQFLDFAWVPKQSRFLVVHGDVRPDVSIYEITDKFSVKLLSKRTRAKERVSVFSLTIIELLTFNSFIT
jgi:uncharacterized protein with WD repeat